MWRCPSCGVVNSKDLTCNYCKQPAPPDAEVDAEMTVGKALAYYKLLRFGIGGLICMGFGAWLLFDSETWDDPKNFTMADLLPGLAAVGAGMLMIGLGLWLFWKTRAR